MCEGELATVSRAVRSAYDVLKGSVRARRGKLTMGGCLKPSEDRKRQTSEQRKGSTLENRFRGRAKKEKPAIFENSQPSWRTAAPEDRKESAEGWFGHLVRIPS